MKARILVLGALLVGMRVDAADVLVHCGKLLDPAQGTTYATGNWPVLQRENFRNAFLAGATIAFGTDAAVYPHGDNWKQEEGMLRRGQSHFNLERDQLEPSAFPTQSEVRSECFECTRLWHEYTVATIEHIRMDGNARVAVLEYNREKVEALAPKVEEAEQHRNDLREAIRRHRESAHP